MTMWRRLPTWFPNIKLTMLPINEAELQQVLECGWLREVAFKTEPRVNKFEIKAFLESVHGMQVERVSTINYQGKKQRTVDNKGRPHYRRLSDWKKAYVIFKPPPEKLEEWQQQKKKKQQLWQVAEEKRQLGIEKRTAHSEWQRQLNQEGLSHEQRLQRQQERKQQKEAEAAKLPETRFSKEERVLLQQQRLQRQLDGWQQQAQSARRGLKVSGTAVATQQDQRQRRRQHQQRQPGAE